MVTFYCSCVSSPAIPIAILIEISLMLHLLILARRSKNARKGR